MTWLWLTPAVLAGALLLAAGLVVLLGALRHRGHPVVAEVLRLSDETTAEPSGAVRSVQAAELALPAEALDRIWTPADLERLARTYWRYLSQITLGLIRVAYTEGERMVVLIHRPLVLLRFQKPEYEMDGRRGIVRWRIERGLLVSRRGRGGDGYLQIDVCRHEQPMADGRVKVRVEVEVANFYPSIASRLSKWVYTNTQSRIHVLVTHGFLRSLVRLELAQSRVGMLVPDPDDVPDPGPPPQDRTLTRSADRP